MLDLRHRAPVVLIALALAILLGGPSAAAGPPVPALQADSGPLLAFQSDRTGDWDIFVTGLGPGEVPVNLTQHPATDLYPDWSPDGTRLAFQSDRARPEGTDDIFTMNADGTGLVNLTNTPADDHTPAWSPDGSMIAFSSNRGGSWGVWVMNADGSAAREVSPPDMVAYAPTWSAGGRHLVYLVVVVAGEDFDLYRSPLEGGTPAVVTSGAGQENWPALSPDGRLLAFNSNRSGTDQLYLANADGAAVRLIARDSAARTQPAWSPDGQWLAFSSASAEAPADILVADANGGQVTPLVTHAADDRHPAWRPGPWPADFAPGAQAAADPSAADSVPDPASTDEASTVPDVVGLSTPVATARMHAAGIAVSFTIAPRPADASLPPEHISAQSVAPGTPISDASTVELTILREVNATLIYDDNDLTFVNQTERILPIAGVVFESVGGNPAARYEAARFEDYLRERQCLQLWSIGRNGPKPLDECRFIQGWRWTNEPGHHFWTGTNGATAFRVLQDGVERAVCEIPAGRCDVYLAEDSVPLATPFVYFAYTAERWMVHNPSAELAMPIRGLTVTDARNGNIISIGDAALYGDAETVGLTGYLAPGQCLFLHTAGHPRPLEDCFVTQTNTVAREGAFWQGGFTVNSTTEGDSYDCPPPEPDRMNVCIMAR